MECLWDLQMKKTVFLTEITHLTVLDGIRKTSFWPGRPFELFFIRLDYGLLVFPFRFLLSKLDAFDMWKKQLPNFHENLEHTHARAPIENCQIFHRKKTIQIQKTIFPLIYNTFSVHLLIWTPNKGDLTVRIGQKVSNSQNPRPVLSIPEIVLFLGGVTVRRVSFARNYFWDV